MKTLFPHLLTGLGAFLLALVCPARLLATSPVTPGVVVAWGDNTYGESTVPAGLSNVVQVAGGFHHSLALKSDGTVVAWGANSYGEGTIPSGLSNVMQIGAGVHYSGALKSDGTVIAWGWNFYGESTVPSGLNNVVQIAVGHYHSLALKSDGTVVAWGYNIDGRCSIPSGLSNVVQIATGDSHSLALKSDGTVVAWGSNNQGACSVPSGLSNVVQVAGGDFRSVALKSDGTVIAWGADSSGQSTIPSGLSNVVQIAAFSIHSLALKSDGAVVAWGDNSYGQSTIPNGLNNVLQVAAGGAHSLAIAAPLSLSDGLVAYYPFNGNANDASGNGNNGTVHGATLSADRFGNPNSAYSFDGAGNFISIPDNPLLALSTNFTVSVWYYQNNVVPDPGYSVRIVDKGTAGLPDGYVLSAGSMSDRRTSYIGATALISPGNFDVARWHHIAVTTTGSVSRMYMDGTEVTSNAGGSPPTNTLPLFIGAPHVGCGGGCGVREFFNGRIDDVRIYNRAISPQEVQLLANPGGIAANGLVAYYPFNGNANDASGYGNDGTVINTVLTTDRFGTSNSSYYFNGTSAEVTFGSAFAMENEQTVVVWVNPSTITTRQTILEKAIPGYGGEVDFEMSFDVGGALRWLVNTDDGATGLFSGVTNGTYIPAGQWSCIAGVIDKSSNETRLYVNGIQVAANSMGGRFVRNYNRPFRIGRGIGNQFNGYFGGKIDDVRIYNRALSDTEIAILADSVNPSITTVSPNPVPGSNSRQNFTINGGGFNADCTVTLRDLTTGETFPNRPKLAQTSTSITLNPIFGTPANTWSVEVINPGGISSGQYQFSVTSPASLASVTVNGPPSLAAGASTAFTATAAFSAGSPQDVTSQAAWSVAGGPGGTYMIGHTLYAGTGSASVAHLQASFTSDTGTRTGGLDVSIGTGLSATLGTPQLGFQYGSGSSLHYRVTATVNVSGGTGSASALWIINGNPISSATGLTLDTAVVTPPGSGTVQVTVSDQGGHSKTVAANVRFDKAPQVNEQFAQVKAGVRTPGILYAADGTSAFAFPPNHAGRDNGVVVIIHGLNDSVDSGWMKDMAGAIGNKLGVAAAPNIILYDWRSDAAPLGKGVEFLMSAAGEAVDIFPPGNGIRGVVNTLLGTTLITGALSGTAFLFLAEALASRPEGEAHGFALASYLSEQIDAGNIDATKPIHLIGHSAGGFVAANCGLGLLAKRHPTQLQVTTLDTPFLRGVQVLFVKANGGKFDRYVSSAFGELVPGVVALNNLPALAKFLLSTSTAGLLGNTVTATELIPLNASYHVGADIDTIPGHWWQDVTRAVANHADAHDWYTKTVNTPDSYGEGFYYSPFLNHSFPAALASLAKTAALLQPAALGQSLVTGLSTFGNVSENSGSYTLVEQGNAGIYQQMTIPMNASTLKFNVQFTHAGDGDFLEVTFGNHPVLVNVPDGDTFHGGSVPIEIPIVYLGGETGQLLFKLNGVGQDNAIVQIDSITITTDDDADHDGLTYAQEMALGTDPRYADTDGDGISDGDEVNVYHTNPLLADSDGDGISDGDEIAAGTNPLDPKSGFKVVAAQRLPNGSFALSWPAIAGKTYRVLRSTTVDFASFDVLAAGLEPATTTATYTDASLPPGTPAAFYRVLTE